MNIAYIGLFGVAGVLTRYFIEAQLASKVNFIPLPTFTANMLGCFLVGIFYAITLSKGSSPLLTGAIIGFCGGLTTFSSYALQSLNLINQGFFTRSSIYLILSPSLGMLLAFIGMKLAHSFTTSSN